MNVVHVTPQSLDEVARVMGVSIEEAIRRVEANTGLKVEVRTPNGEERAAVICSCLPELFGAVQTQCHYCKRTIYHSKGAPVTAIKICAG